MKWIWFGSVEYSKSEGHKPFPLDNRRFGIDYNWVPQRSRCQRALVSEANSSAHTSSFHPFEIELGSGSAVVY